MLDVYLTRHGISEATPTPVLLGDFKLLNDLDERIPMQMIAMTTNLSEAFSTPTLGNYDS